MSNIRRIHPKMTDEKIAELLQSRRDEDYTVLREAMAELYDTVDETIRNGQVELLAYGKLLQWLRDSPEPDLIRLCAASMWLLLGSEGYEWNINQSS